MFFTFYILQAPGIQIMVELSWIFCTGYGFFEGVSINAFTQILKTVIVCYV